MPSDTLINWNAHAKILKYSPDQVAWATQKLGYEPPGHRLSLLFRDPEDGVTEEPGNLLVTVGLNLVTSLIEGGAGTPFAHADAIVGVGSTATAATVADTALGADNTAGAYYQQADVSFPTQSNGVITTQATFASGNANFAWNEWALATGSGGITPGTHLSAVATSVVMLNHKVASLGTKGSGSAWVFVSTVTLSLSFALELSSCYATCMAIRIGAFPQLADKAWVTDQYVTQGKSCPQIAAELGCMAGAVEYRLRHFGITARGRHYGRWNPKPCARCGTEFTPSGPAALFCSAACRAGTAVCEGCGTEFPLVAPQQQVKNGVVYPRKFCSFECRQRHWARTSAHRYVDSANGYVTIVVPPTMSRRIDGGGYVELNVGALNSNGGRVKEHRWVMEQRLGRALLSHEEVHHKNGHRDDNDRCPNCPASTPPPEIRKGRLHCAECGWVSTTPPNLELWTTSQPHGQRVEDKIEWALGFLAEYGHVSFQAFLPADAA